MSAIDQAFIRAYQGSAESAARVAVPPGGPRLAEPRVDAARPAAPPAPHFARRAPAMQRDLPATLPLTAAVTQPRSPEPQAPPARRPLSELVKPAPQADASFRPALEVDGYRYSQLATQLCEQHGERWSAALAVLQAIAEEGRTLIGVAGADVGVGCTTAVVCLARLAAGLGKRVAMVDGDFVSAALARELGLAVDLGWEDVLSGRVPLAESAVLSLADNSTLLPLVQGGVPAAEKLDAVHASVTAGVLRYHHDLVLVDLGSLADPVQAPIARRIAHQCRLDGVLVAARGSAPRNLFATCPELAASMLGVVENFCR